MTAKEMQELLVLMNWTRTKLAAELEITANAVDKWFAAGRAPGGPTSILLSDWLIRARNDEPLRAAAKQKKQRELQTA